MASNSTLAAVAESYREMPGEPGYACAGQCGFTAYGPAWARTIQFHGHWPSCRAVESLTFHPDGSLASVTFPTRR